MESVDRLEQESRRSVEPATIRIKIKGASGEDKANVSDALRLAMSKLMGQMELASQSGLKLRASELFRLDFGYGEESVEVKISPKIEVYRYQIEKMGSLPEVSSALGHKMSAFHRLVISAISKIAPETHEKAVGMIKDRLARSMATDGLSFVSNFIVNAIGAELKKKLDVQAGDRDAQMEAAEALQVTKTIKM